MEFCGDSLERFQALLRSSTLSEVLWRSVGLSEDYLGRFETLRGVSRLYYTLLRSLRLCRALWGLHGAF